MQLQLGNVHAPYSKVTLEFSMNDDAPVNLSEMRFHIPGILSFCNQSINILILSD